MVVPFSETGSTKGLDRFLWGGAKKYPTSYRHPGDDDIICISDNLKHLRQLSVCDKTPKEMSLKEV